MTRIIVFVTAIAATYTTGCVEAAVRAKIISEPTAARHGLTRPWFGQLQIHRGMTELQHMVLHNGTLFLQTDNATLHAIDAETGQSLWSAQVGRRGHPSMAPGVNDDLVGVVNGSFLYVVNRFNGKILWKAQTDGAPGAGAALSDVRAYVPMVDGLVASYRLETLKDPMAELMKIQADQLTEEEKAEMEVERRETIRLQQEYIPPLLCRSWGRIFVSPVVTIQSEGEELVAWPTDRGLIFVGRIDRPEERAFSIRYRLKTSGEIVAPPTYRPPDPADPADHGTLFAASQDGFIHALMAHNGDPLWRFSAGEPLVQPPVYVNGHLFAAVQLGGLHCLDAKTGDQKWWSPNILQFVAMSKDRVYAVDDLKRLVALSLETGSRLDTMSILGHEFQLINTETDRIYLADRSGLVQCLHEVGFAEPLVHKALRAPAEGGDEAQTESGQPATQPAGPAEQEGPAGQSPFDVQGGATENDIDAGGNPFEAIPPADNPFGGPGA
jgi:outer membrane protein assembly factor BamB